MSRGGKGGGRGGRKMGPDMSWQDDDIADSTTPLKRVPGPMFPERHIPVPKPMTTTQKSQVQCLIGIRERIRNGPLYTVLDPSQLLDDKGKVNVRAGFDPFNDQERFTKKYHLKRRTIPDHSERGGHTLKLFPVELWPILDPKKRQKEYWNTLSDDVKAKLGEARGTKRKREKLKFNDADEDDDADGRKAASGSESEEDGIIDAAQRRKKVAAKTRRNDPTQSKGREKKGLDAEDDYPEVEQQDEDGEGGGAAGAEEEPQDSEFGSDEDDDDYDDYNAENYFDDGADDDMGDIDDDGGGGGGGGGDYY